mmetsp:Transcript_7202/g.10523  ORF Transcript_7202/g.10523 Transcript_7202/m.10523 type:complete len:774 (-) Transcript_7202:155-2476(-)
MKKRRKNQRKVSTKASKSERSRKVKISNNKIKDERNRSNQEDNHEVKPIRQSKRRSTRLSKPIVAYNENSEASGEEYHPASGDEESDNASQELRKKRQSRRSTSKEPKKICKTMYCCPHCGKEIGSSHGLKYHVDKLVCRQVKEKPKASKIRKVLPDARSGKRFRGSKEDRTCPTCKKEFTSALGRDYHVKHKVCKGETMDTMADTLAFPTLVKGSKFITKFGIVEVISDDRAISTYTYPKSIGILCRAYNNAQNKQACSKRKRNITMSVPSRLRRRVLTRNYEDNNVSQKTTNMAYFDTAIPSSRVLVATSNQPLDDQRHDPVFPPQSFPDRIVHCKIVPDMRPRVYHIEDLEKQDQNEGSGHKATRTGISMNATLYIRRRDLTKDYNPNVILYSCPGCGPHFTSKEGFLYHVRNKVCYKKARLRGQQRQQGFETIDLRIRNHSTRNSSREQQKRCKAENSIYPQVWLFLGFKIPAATKGKTRPSQKTNDQISNMYDVENMNSKLETLREEFELQNSRILEHQMGAMYPQIYNSLGFIDPKKKKLEELALAKAKLDEERRNAKLRLRRRSSRISLCHQRDQEEKNETGEVETLLPEIPSGPMYDLQVLIDEIDTGRYPSITRYKGEYPTKCVICKNKDDLLFCKFCKNAMHLDCAMSKIFIKEPDPGDDFMCPSCAKISITRRNRAEKRRLKKVAEVRDRYQGAQEHNEDTEEPNTDEELQENPNPESETHALAKVGQELSELLELLGDARNRMHQMSEITKVNKLRRSQFC